MPQSPMLSSNIKTVVMLMLENRSLDNLFGHLYKDRDQVHYWPPGSPKRYDGIPANAQLPAINWDGNLEMYPIVPVPVKKLRAKGNDPSIIPWWDPTEEYLSFFDTGHGVVNQLFGDQYRVSKLPPYGTAPGMSGFLQDYWTWYTDPAYGGMDITWTFPEELLPNMHAAAKAGAISDAWFSSVPTDTNPNRAFSLLGTSLGRERNAHITSVEKFNSYTLFQGLAKKKKKCGLYYTDIWHDHQCFTAYTFPQAKRGLHEVGTVDTFLARAAAGTLPDFSYVEPKWGYGVSGSIMMTQGTDLHPPTSVTPGDQFVGAFLQALSKSKQWPNMLVLILFDEHGGTYDHAKPAWGAINPDGRRGKLGFKFDLFGVRVPAILISPYVRSRTVFRAPLESKYPFDHTSVIRTLMSWAGGDASAFLKRAQAAPSFEGVLLASDEEAADNASVIQKTLSALPPADAKPREMGNALFDGLAFASVRAILATSTSAEEVVRKIERYRRDPVAFEKRVAKGGLSTNIDSTSAAT